MTGRRRIVLFIVQPAVILWLAWGTLAHASAPSIGTSTGAAAAVTVAGAVYPAIGKNERGADSFAVMGAALNMQGQTNWFFYNSGDAPEGAYMGWLYQARTLTGTVELPRRLPRGRYHIFFYGVSYGSKERVQASIGGGTSTTVVLNDYDENRYWSDDAAIDVAAESSTLQVQLTRDPAVSDDQRFLFRGLYITTNDNIVMIWDGHAVDLTYPTAMDDSAPVKGNLVPNGGFETPIDASWGFPGQGGGRTAPINTMWDNSEGHSGQGSLKFTFDAATSVVPGDSAEKVISRVYHLKPNKRYTLSMWMKASPGLTTQATISLVNTFVPPAGFPGQYIVSGNPVNVTDTWSRVSVTGYLLKYPTSDYQIHVQTSGGPSGTYLLIDDVQLEEGGLTDFAPAAPVEAGIFIDMASKPGNIFYTDDALQTDVVIRNNTSQNATATLRYEIYDRLNSLVVESSLSLVAPPLTTRRMPFNLSPNGKQGIFRLVSWIENVDRTEREVVYSVIPRPQTMNADPSSSLGIHPNYSDTQLKVLQRMGIKFARALSPAAFCRWTTVEPQPGVFAWFDAPVQLANTYGIATMCTIGTNRDWPEWADNRGRPDLREWRQFVTELVTHYHPIIKYWEIWNEPYAVFSPSLYAQMLKIAATAIEDVDPAARIIGMGGSPPDYIQQVIASLEKYYPNWDWRQHIPVLATHEYPDGVPPESLKPVLDYGLPVWNTEAGAWDWGLYQGVNSNFVSWGETVWPHTDAVRYYEGTIDAPDVVTENYLRTIASGQSKYFYYDSRYYAAPDLFKSHPTMLEYDGTIRAKGIAYAIAGSLIDHSAGLGNVSSDPQSFLLVFNKGGGPVAALFSADNNPRQITFSLNPAQFQVLDIMGNPMPIGNAIRYGRTPVYIKGIGINAAALKAALQAGTIKTATDTMPPNLSISDAPRGPIANHDFRVRWIAVDDSSLPNLGEVNPVTNTASTPNPNAIVYSYYLSGYSASWSGWSASTFVDFSNVPSGSYTFSVVAADSAGNQSAPVTRSIVIN